MTRDRNGELVCAARLRHSPNSLRHADLRRDIGIARRRPRRNLPQRLPDALLECRATDIERQIEAESRLLDESDDFGDKLLIAGFVSDQIGLFGNCFSKSRTSTSGSSPIRIEHTPLLLCAARIEPSEHCPMAK